MLKKERQAFIIKEINLHNKVLSSDLSMALDVSEDTIRRDLNELALEGRVVKVHGGALSRSYQVAAAQADTYAYEKKEIIAMKTLKIIKDGMVILTSGGTTMREIAKRLPESLQVTFFTISPIIALELAEHPKAEVILLGGQLSNASKVTIGAEVVQKISEIKADICILGINGLDLDGVTDSDYEIVQVKKAMIKASKQVIIPTISEKLNTALRYKVTPTADIDCLITELSPLHDTIQPYLSQVKLVL
ncbi:MAG: DeoR/GlpR family DNA-binding transcription regulator [Flectobacillus sp.]|uniref:DeoR/GlpR family DNA-binding transcription regulator n=1 Tax=Flectobacillus sp. TaxID=50419 RepID=UPI003B9951BD